MRNEIGRPCPPEGEQPEPLGGEDGSGVPDATL